jgi:hypothetical protein
MYAICCTYVFSHVGEEALLNDEFFDLLDPNTERRRGSVLRKRWLLSSMIQMQARPVQRDFDNLVMQAIME